MDCTVFHDLHFEVNSVSTFFSTNEKGSAAVKFITARRRNPFVAVFLLIAALGTVGITFSAVSNIEPAQASLGTQTQVEEGKKLYLEGCSSCHGMNAQGATSGPTLIGVGAAAVHFQVSTGRMPLAAPGAQATAKDSIYDDNEVAAMAAYIASLAPGQPSQRRRTGLRECRHCRGGSFPDQLRSVSPGRRPGRCTHRRQVRT